MFRPEEVRTTLEACGPLDGRAGAPMRALRDRLLFETLAETGMRLGECLALHHRDWHLGRGSTPFIDITPRTDHPLGLRVKNGRARRVYVSDGLERLYGEWVWTLCDAGDDVEAARWCRRLGGQAISTTGMSSSTWTAASAWLRDFLYREPELRARIQELRAAERPVEPEATPSRSTVVHALTQQLRGLRAENEDLRRRLEAAHGEIVRLKRMGGGRRASTGEEGGGLARLG